MTAYETDLLKCRNSCKCPVQAINPKTPLACGQPAVFFEGIKRLLRQMSSCVKTEVFPSQNALSKVSFIPWWPLKASPKKQERNQEFIPGLRRPHISIRRIFSQRGKEVSGTEQR